MSVGVRHRPDIDGLRALAILPVVGFHARVPWMSGGFIGVDVFLVISGYLITTLILGEIREGRFSVARFYERRIRRILPALLALFLVSSIAAHALLLPRDARGFGGSLLAAVFFSSNIFFWRQSGYFDQPAETKPLLHTWSLAVEEQFYIVYPLVLYLIGRWFRGRYALVLAAVLATSMALSIWGTAAHPTAAFYLAPTRAWELLLGALLALGVIPETRHPKLANLLGVIGLSGIGYGVYAFSPATPFPGVTALVPALGAALIIYCGIAATPLITRLLSIRPLVFVGLISYSLYLWHWVLLVLARYYVVRPITRGEIAIVITASAVAAIASWRFIERPFRGPQGIGSRRWIFSGAAVSSIAFGCYGVFALASNGFPGRFGNEAQVVIADSKDVWNRRQECSGRMCVVGTPGAQPTFLLWGDSHAGALAPAVEQVAIRDHLSGLIAYQGSCAPLLHLRRYDLGPEGCDAFNDSVLSRIESSAIRTVFLHAHWGLYAEGHHYERVAPPLLLSASRRVEDNYSELVRLLRVTLGELRRRQVDVVIIASTPEVRVDVPSALLRSLLSGSSADFAPLYAEFADRQFRAFRALRLIAGEYDVPIVYPHELLCNADRCSITRDGHALYLDDDHLNTRGAMYLVPMFDRLLAKTPGNAR